MGTLPSLDDPPRQQTNALRSILLLAVAFLVGLAIHWRDGEYLPTGRPFSPPIFLVGGSMLAAVLLLAVPSVARRWPRFAGSFTTEVARAAAIAFLTAQFALLLRSPPSGWNPWSDDLVDASVKNLRLYYSGSTVAAVLVLLTAWVGHRRAAAATLLGLLLATHFALSAWMIRSSPEPHIDVWHFQQIGGRTLLAGQNPYRWTSPTGHPVYPDIYADTAQAKDRAVYGRDLSAGAWLNFGFPYPPLSLLMSTAGYAAAGDHRYAQAACLALAGLLIAAAAGRGRLAWGTLAAAVLLFTPRSFFIVGRGWTEPLAVLWLATTVFCAVRMPKLLPLSLGLLLASKQYLVFALPLAWLLVPNWRDWRSVAKLIGGAVLTAALVSLPLALWDWPAFWHSAFAVQADAPFRADALSWLAWYHDVRGGQPPAWIGFIAAVAALAAAIRWCPRTVSGFCAALAIVLLAFIGFGKQAFANYYLLVIAAAACGVASAGTATRSIPLADDSRKP